jgi:flagellin
MVVNHNMAAICGSTQLRYNVKKMEDSSRKISSGYKIVAASDDAAGLKISETMRNQIKGLDTASRNTQDGISMLQTADAALQETQEVLDRMVELTTTAANDTHSDADRGAIQSELDQLQNEIDRIAYTTNFNQQYMLSPDADPDHAIFQLQTGELSGESIEVKFVDASRVGLGLTDPQAIKVDSFENAGIALAQVQNAVEKAAEYRDTFGAQQTRLESSVRNTDNTSQNTQSSESKIRDTDMSMELVLYTTNRILVSASQSVLAQYNDDAKSVAKLLE